MSRVPLQIRVMTVKRKRGLSESGRYKEDAILTQRQVTFLTIKVFR